MNAANGQLSSFGGPINISVAKRSGRSKLMANTRPVSSAITNDSRVNYKSS
jgi:hypothetical protein